MKGYNIQRVVDGEYDDIDGINSTDGGFRSEMGEIIAFYGNVAGKRVALVVGDSNDEYSAYKDKLKFYLRGRNNSTLYALKWTNGSGSKGDAQFPVGVYSENGKVGQFRADPPEDDYGARALGLELGSTNKALLGSWDVVEQRDGSDYVYVMDNDRGDELWRGVKDGEWRSSDVLFVGDADDVPSGWNDGPFNRTAPQYDLTSNLSDQLCQGESDNIELTISNDNPLIDVIGTLEFTNNITGETSEEDIVLKPDETITKQYSISVPVDAQPGEQTVASVNIDTDADQNATKTLEFNSTIGTPSSDISISGIESPSTVCVGESFTFAVEGQNLGSCGIDATVEVSNDQDDTVWTDSRSIRDNSTSKFTFREDAPSVVGETTFTVDLMVGNIVDSKTFTTDISSGELAINNVISPESVCVGGEYDIEVESVNTGKCDAEARFTLKSQTGEVVETTNLSTVRSSSSTTHTFEQTLTSGSGENYTIGVQQFANGSYTNADSTDVAIESKVPDIQLSSIDVDDFVCQGSSISSTIGVVNNGGCDGRYRVRMYNEDLGIDKTSSSSTLSSGRDDTLDIDVNVPSNSSSSDSGVINIEVQVDRQGVWETSDNSTSNITVGSADIALMNYSLPSSACIGKSASANIEVGNSSKCEGAFSAKLIDVDTDKVLSQTTATSVSQAETKVQSLDVTLDSSYIDKTSINAVLELYEVTGNATEKIASEQFEIEVKTPSLEIGSTNFPESVCIGKTFNAQFVVANTSSCDGTVRTRFINEDTKSTQVSDVIEISANSSSTISVEPKVIKSLRNKDSTTYSMEVESKLADTWYTVTSSTISVDVLKPSLSLDTSSVPEYNKPGSMSSQIRISNEGDCDTSAKVDINGSSYDVEVESGSSSNVNFDTDINIGRNRLDIQVVDESIDSLVHDKSVYVTAYKYAHLDTAGRTLTVVGGYGDNVQYRSLIVGSGIEEGEDIDESDRIISLRNSTRVRGEASSDPENTDTVAFDSIDAINIVSQQSMVWIVDEEVQDESNSFQYNTLVGRNALTGMNLPTNDPETTVSTINGSSVGAIRSKVWGTPLDINTSRIARLYKKMFK